MVYTRKKMGKFSICIKRKKSKIKSLFHDEIDF